MESDPKVYNGSLFVAFGLKSHMAAWHQDTLADWLSVIT
jgi:hypothetical protein